MYRAVSNLNTHSGLLNFLFQCLLTSEELSCDKKTFCSLGDNRITESSSCRTEEARDDREERPGLARDPRGRFN